MGKCLSLNGSKTYIHWKITQDTNVSSNTGFYQDVYMSQEKSQCDITCNQFKRIFRLCQFSGKKCEFPNYIS